VTPARERLLVVLLLLVLGGAAVLVSTQVFASVVLDGRQQPLVVPGSQAAPALAPIGIAQLALAGALSIAGPVARRVLGALLVVLGAAVVLLLLPVVADPASAAAGAVGAATGVTDGSAVRSLAGSAWPAAGVVLGVAGAVAGVVVLVRAGRWSTGGRRFRQQGEAPARAADPVSEWDALTRGGDPTDDPGRGGGSP